MEKLSREQQVRIGSRLRTLREDGDLTQERVAEALSISLAHYADVERGSAAPSLSLLIKMSEFFHVGLDYFILDFKENPEEAIKNEILYLLNNCDYSEQKKALRLIHIAKHGKFENTP